MHSHLPRFLVYRARLTLLEHTIAKDRSVSVSDWSVLSVCLSVTLVIHAYVV